MNDYQHHVSGIFPHCKQAEEALAGLVERGLPRERLHIFATDLPQHTPPPSAASDSVLKDVVVDGAIGTAVGAGAGALAQFALVAANISLFVASPLLAPLVMLGWGASIGGLIGATVGVSGNVENEERQFADLIRDAVANGQAVLVAETRTEQETEIARKVVQASIGDYNDVNMLRS